VNAQKLLENNVIGIPAAGITLPGFEQEITVTKKGPSPSSPAVLAKPSKSNVFVAGILAVDYTCDHQPRSKTTSPLEMHTSNPARIGQSLGGVGHNVARAASLMGSNVRFCSAVGDDLSGKAALAALSQEGLPSAAVKVLPMEAARRTAQYISVNEQNKDLAIAMADMSILNVPEAGEEDVIQRAFVDLWEPQLTESSPTHLVVDANWPPKYLQMWLAAASIIGAHVTFEPVSNAKSTIPFELPAVPGQSQVDSLPAFPKSAISLASPNSYELAAMHTAARERGFFERQDWWEVIDALGIPSTGARVAMAMATTSELVDQGIPQQSVQLLPFIPSICTKLGSKGVLVTQLLNAGDPRLNSFEYAPYILSRCNNDTECTLGVGGVYMRLFPPSEQVEAADIVSVNGVGDTFVGTLVAQLAKAKAQGIEKGVEECIDIAQRAAVLTLKSSQAVSPDLSTLKLK
jgi:pseudouridine-5'-phosphate glycosidase/pseudouridine kinase